MQFPGVELGASEQYIQVSYGTRACSRRGSAGWGEYILLVHQLFILWTLKNSRLLLSGTLDSTAIKCWPLLGKPSDPCHKRSCDDLQYCSHMCHLSLDTELHLNSCLPHYCIPAIREKAKSLKYTQPLSPMATCHLTPLPTGSYFCWDLGYRCKATVRRKRAASPMVPDTPHPTLYQTFAGKD